MVCMGTADNAEASSFTAATLPDGSNPEAKSAPVVHLEYAAGSGHMPLSEVSTWAVKISSNTDFMQGCILCAVSHSQDGGNAVSNL